MTTKIALEHVQQKMKIVETWDRRAKILHTQRRRFSCSGNCNSKMFLEAEIIAQCLVHAASLAALVSRWLFKYAVKDLPPFNPVIINKDFTATIWEHI